MGEEVMTDNESMKIQEASQLQEALCAWRLASQGMRFAWYRSEGITGTEGDAFYTALINKHRALEFA